MHYDKGILSTISKLEKNNMINSVQKTFINFIHKKQSLQIYNKS